MIQGTTKDWVLCLQSDTRLSRCHVICYSAGYNLLQNLKIPKSGGGEYEIRCMISAYNAESKEARCYLELVEKVREKKLEDSMIAMGAKLAGPPTTFSADQAGKKSSYDDECAASLFSVHQDSRKPGWTLVGRGTPSVEPREMVQARAGDAVAREHEDLVVERRVMLENPGDFGHDGTVLGKQKAADGGAAPFVEADCCRSGKKSKPGLTDEQKRCKGSLINDIGEQMQRWAGLMELAVENEELKKMNHEISKEKDIIKTNANKLQTRNEALETGTLELQPP